MITAQINVNVTPLPDNDIWFLNAAAWNTYWSNVTADVDIDALATTLYVPVPYNTAIQPYAMANDQDVVTKLTTLDQFNSLKAQLQALDNAFQTMRTELRNGGLITNAQ